MQGTWSLGRASSDASSFPVAFSQRLRLPGCRSLMLPLTFGTEGTGGRVHVSVPQYHTQEPFAPPELTDKLIPEHPAARRDAFDQRPPGQPSPLQSEFLLRPAPAGKVGNRMPADFSSSVCWGSSLCLPRRDARRT